MKREKRQQKKVDGVVMKNGKEEGREGGRERVRDDADGSARATVGAVRIGVDVGDEDHDRIDMRENEASLTETLGGNENEAKRRGTNPSCPP